MSDALVEFRERWKLKCKQIGNLSLSQSQANEIWHCYVDETYSLISSEGFLERDTKHLFDQIDTDVRISINSAISNFRNSHRGPVARSIEAFASGLGRFTGRKL